MEKVFEEQSKRLEDAMNRLVEDLDKTHLRELHANMHICAAKCCQNKDGTVENVYNCVEGCRYPVDQVWGLVEDELHLFHEKLTNCLENCSTKMTWIATPTEAQLTRSAKDMEDCTGKCVDTMIGTLPKLLEKMKQDISRTRTKKKQESDSVMRNSTNKQ